MTPFDFAGIAALLLALVAFYKAFRGTVPEKASAMQTYQEMLDKAASDCQKLRVDVAKLQEDERKLRARIRELERVQDNYKRGVERLVLQLEAHDITPAWSPSSGN